ncbi:MAG: type II toxin-antitoxin system VapC family toxin [Deltaproteobacteria bacterium]|nr:type II toxin-antitoxin system VapC family toxin [Deltaproteobacteria bacterium]MBT4638007.1 type II toxin-antitoxin system VapC family toxin [Deltaproteobacteria bacterium]MBT6501057.1 type II toxin-antitoxin system VapC family toxin [Deltaproteobacteria bacterium]MBT7155950.1 type II toxin-antitoxin system VapC family toxin [Deltaproteobacteria bacterium]MBT7715433.1 type II toxin-antitoxin system VapC family toxin [Deltaproteobacteria bacterium]
MIVDTDVLIWYSRGYQNAIDAIHTLDRFSISVVTYIEVIQEVRNKKELNAFKKALGILNAQVIQIDELISTKAMFYVEQYALSHSMELADALIGASAVIKQLPLITGNEKHYKHLPEIKIQKFQVEI